MTKANVNTVAGAEAAWFESQLPLYRAFPEMYRLNTYLDFLENDCVNVRKYVISSTFKRQVLNLNLEEKSAFDGMNADLSDFGR